ncbi:MAG: pantoate--beta-alanine ligase [Bacteroidales bacterium]|nr:pantoate--beta-alanine ligase [Bacteroidales bacterium]MCF8389199.1 pantoate--beta-alanine ligase [Bacteroidales bacterium]
MEIIYNLPDFREFRSLLDSQSKSIGFVPTMGALHNGHLSLIQKAMESCEIVIVSIFVNPTQFNDPNDLKNYPREIEKDIKKLSPLNPNVIFIPGVEDIYPKPDTRIFDFGNLDKVMEGATRPGHFNGVAQVVSRLFDIVRPHKAFFGQKDFQQLAIIKAMVLQLDYKIEIVSCPIIREENGLAMSSRNSLLTEAERKNASFIYKILKEAKASYPALTIEEISNTAVKKFENQPGINLIYFEIVDSKSLAPVKTPDNSSEIVACVAVKINAVRLIDNLIFD